MGRDINLDGVEISVIKALGFGGGDTSGKELMQRAQDLEQAEVIDSLGGLVMLGYVVSDKGSFRTDDEFERANFHVNSGYSRDLKEALNPTQSAKPKSRRIRRE